MSTETLEHTLLYLNAAQVADLCQRIDPVLAVTDAFTAVQAGKAGITPEAALRWQAGDGTAARSLILPAWWGDTYGCKIINACVGNPDRGLPRAHGLIVLADPDTAAPLCIMEGAHISALRTAAVSVAALHAVRQADTMRAVSVLGCGRQGRTHLELLARTARPQTITAFDTDDRRRQEFASWAAELLPDAAVQLADTAEQAVRAGHAVIAATTVTAGYVEDQWLADGAVFVNVSLDDATEQLLLGCDHLIVDDWALVSGDDTRLLGRLAGQGRVTGPGQRPPVGGRAVDAEIATVLAGNYPRRISDTDRIVINPFGMGVHDIALAARVHAAARAAGIGTTLPR